ncbi:MAG: type VI secretion system membrane subunit TssM [Thiolinea sp.]
MKKLFGIFKQAWFLTLIGIIAISVIIYLFGDILKIGDFRPFSSLQSRYITIGGLTLSWALYHLWRWFDSRRQNQKMLDNLVESSGVSPDEAASEEEVQQLSDNLQDALQTLTSIQKKDGGKQDLYQLPWYVIIGPPGAGKTTLLANSQLHFPLSDKYGKDALRGVGGTRNCDWWFTDEAILLDTAGRYTTQDSRQSVDSAAWKGFLDLLRKNRSHQPINGILIAISMADILQFSAEQLEQHASTIRQRIQELHEHLGIRFPVYMIFTKCDLLSGFSEFYDDLDAQGRDQVWGMTFPYMEKPEENVAGQFETEFRLLEERIYQQLVGKLADERSLERRQALYLFPQQFSALQETLSGFLDQVYRSSRYHESIMLRGVYFTSATQEGTPIDRIMSSLASNYGVSPQKLSRFSDKGKSYFINHLLSGVVFSESGLAGTNLKLKRRLQWLQTLGAIAAVIAAVGLSALLLLSYFNNSRQIDEYQQKIAEVDKKITQIPATNTDLRPYLGVLESARQLSFSYADQKPEVSLLSGFGLSQTKSLALKMDSKYEDLLFKSVRPYAKGLLERNIRQGMLDKPETMFAALKTYLFMGGRAPENLPVDSVPVQGIDWDNNGESSDGYDMSVGLHFKNLLKNSRSGLKVDDELISEARTTIESVDLSKLAYQGFKNAILGKAGKYKFDVLKKDDLDEINRAFVRKSSAPWSEGVPGLFTRKGYTEVFLPNYVNEAKKLSSEAWVLGDNVQVGEIDNAEEKLFAHYQQDFIAAWTNFLADIEARTIADRKQAEAVFLSLTSDSKNLLFRLIEEVSAETTFTKAEGEEQGATDILAGPVPKRVQRKFSEYTDWDSKEEFQKTSDLIGEIHELFSQDDATKETVNNPLKNALDKLEGQANKFPAAIRDIIKSLVLPSERLVVGILKNEAAAQFQQALKDEVGDFCQSKIAGRYPIKKNTKKTISLADFTEFFKIGGTLDQFEQRVMQQAELDPALLARVKKSFSRGKKIRQVFFPTGALKVDYVLKLQQAHPNVAKIEMAIGAGSQEFEPPVVNQRVFSWPSSESVMAIVTRKNPPGQKFSLQLFQGDPWGIYRLVKKNKLLVSDQTGVLQADFSVSTSNTDVFKFVASGLGGFRCPAL